MLKELDIRYGQGELNFFDIYLPESKTDTVYIYIHGGGIETGSRKIGAKMPEFFTSKNIAFASLEYSLYPSTSFPNYLVECAEAVRLIQEKYGFNKMLVGGSSAGGYISMMLYFNKQYFIDAGVDTSKIKGYVFDAGQPTSHFNYLKFDKKTDSRRVFIDEAAPIYYLEKDFTQNEPSLFFICAENDMTNRVNQTNTLITAMKQFKFPQNKLLFKIYDGETHCSYVNKDYYLSDVYEFIKKAKEE